jgi:hypothetical protein
MTSAFGYLLISLPFGYCLWFLGSAVCLAFQGKPIAPAMLHRKSLRLALFVLAFDLLPFQPFLLIASKGLQAPQPASIYVGVACLLNLAFCILAWVNLIRDVDRGYSPGRCSLAAVLLLLASLPPLWLSVMMVRDIIKAQATTQVQIEAKERATNLHFRETCVQRGDALHTS